MVKKKNLKPTSRKETEDLIKKTRRDYLDQENKKGLNFCIHDFRMFHDPKLKGTGYLSFYCKHCLKLEKVKKEYGKEV